MSKRIIRKLMAAAWVAVLIAPVLMADGATPVHNSSFDVTLPVGFEPFAVQTQSVKGKEGTIETKNWISKSPTGEAIVVTVSKMPKKILDPAKLLSSTRDSLLKSLSATLENEEQVGKHAIALTFRSQSAAFLRSRLDVHGDELVQLLYVGRSVEQRNLPSVATLFESFRIAETRAQTAAGSSE